MRFGYINTSVVKNHDEIRQEILKFDPEKIIIDEDTNEEITPKMQELLKTLTGRDEIVTYSCNMLSTSENTLQVIIAKIRNRKSTVRFIDLSSHGMENPRTRALKEKMTQRWC